MILRHYWIIWHDAPFRRGISGGDLCFRIENKWALLCVALLYFNLLCFALFCFSLLCFDLLCYDLVYFVLLCFALFFFVFLCFTLLCFALLALFCFVLIWLAFLLWFVCFVCFSFICLVMCIYIGEVVVSRIIKLHPIRAKNRYMGYNASVMVSAMQYIVRNHLQA